MKIDKEELLQTQENRSELRQMDGGCAMAYGTLCPNCHQGIIDYDGLLNLVCPVCGFTQQGSFT